MDFEPVEREILLFILHGIIYLVTKSIHETFKKLAIEGFAWKIWWSVPNSKMIDIKFGESFRDLLFLTCLIQIEAWEDIHFMAMIRWILLSRTDGFLIPDILAHRLQMWK